MYSLLITEEFDGISHNSVFPTGVRVNRPPISTPNNVVGIETIEIIRSSCESNAFNKDITAASV